MTSSEPPDWSLFPSNLLITVAEKLPIADIIRLCTVCTSWAWTFGRPRNGWPTPPRYRASFVPIPPSVPWMLLPNENSEDAEDADFCLFHDLSDSQVRRVSPVPEMIGRRCVGASPDGWLVTLDIELNPRVLNPLTREELPLPSLSTLLPYIAELRILCEVSFGNWIQGLKAFANKTHIGSRYLKEWLRDSYFLKIILTSGPPFGVAAVIFGTAQNSTQLAFSRIGDASWTPVPASGELRKELESVVDVMYHAENNRVYVMSSSACVMFFDLHTRDWPSGLWMSAAPLPTKPTLVGKNKYKYLAFTRPCHLIFSSGRLLRIWKEVGEYNIWDAERARQGLRLEVEDEVDKDDNNIVMTKTLEVDFKTLDPMMVTLSDMNPWRIHTNASDLDDKAVFVGCNHAFSLPAAGRPGLRKNSIYFTETSRCGHRELGHHVSDAGVVNVQTGAFKRIFSSDTRAPPVWFMPSKHHFELLS